MHDRAMLGQSVPKHISCFFFATKSLHQVYRDKFNGSNDIGIGRIWIFKEPS